MTRTAGATAGEGRGAAAGGPGPGPVSLAVSGGSGSGPGVGSPRAASPVPPTSSRVSGDSGASHVLSRSWGVGSLCY